MRFLLILVLLSVFFCLSEQYAVVKVDGNRGPNELAHHTLFRNRNSGVVKEAAVIVRRGASFTINLQFDSPAKKLPTVNVQYLIPDPDSGDPQFSENLGWKVVSATTGNRGTSTITIPGKAAIGRYQLLVSGSTGVEKSLPFIVLLNPWSPQDETYFPVQEELKEYVLNEEGIIWVGLNKDYEGKLWRFHQFEGSNLETAIALLYNPSIGSQEAASEPVAIARHISMVTAENVCRGKWGEGSYTKGCEDEGEYCCSATKKFPGSQARQNCLEPWNVHNTTVILSQYLNSRVSFQYCQCFVFAALINTIGRSVGFPTRAITNFNSAADHNGNGAIDQYYEEDSKGYLNHVSGQDSVWNFHVWNECWMKRAGQNGVDLNGWQAIDGTPQVESDGHYQVGPASLNAIFRKKDLRFDTTFVISEVDAPTNVWVKSKKSGGKFVKTKTTLNNPYDSQGTTGRKISTKKPGLISQACLKRSTLADRACEADRIDVTYKYKPQGPAPRGGIRKRAEGGDDDEEEEGDPEDEDGKEKAGLEVKAIFPKISKNNKVVEGDSITYGYLVKNKGDSEAVVHILFEVKATEYTDDEIFHVDHHKKTYTIAPNSELDVVRVVKPAKYAKLFHGSRNHEDQAYLEFEISINVEDKSAFWFHSNRIFVHAKEEVDRFY